MAPFLLLFLAAIAAEFIFFGFTAIVVGAHRGAVADGLVRSYQTVGTGTDEIVAARLLECLQYQFSIFGAIVL